MHAAMSISSRTAHAARRANVNMSMHAFLWAGRRLLACVGTEVDGYVLQQHGASGPRNHSTRQRPAKEHQHSRYPQTVNMLSTHRALIIYKILYEVCLDIFSQSC